MRHLITSALPYINGIKHLGNLAGSLLPADVHARYRRMAGDEVLFICATDDHGTPAELGAEEAHQDVRAYCDQQHALQRKIYDDFRLSFDWFGRTSSPQNRELTQHLAHKLEQNGLMQERTTKQVYSIDDKRFLPDRYIEGICPHCGFNGARGDQCDGCGLQLDPTDLIEPRSKISGSKNLEVRDTAHLFLCLSKIQDRVSTWIETHAQDWPNLTLSIARKWLVEGLQDRSITRDLSWGVPVTNADGTARKGFENKVFYVWFDAPIGYIGATKEWADAGHGNWESWWRTDKGAGDVTYTEFMGKDNVVFHTVNFPSTLIGSGEDWKLVDRLKSFNWVNWYGDKFSTSRKRGVFMNQAIALLPADYWRWYLMANAPEGSDFSFTWETFQSTCNADLANNLGNFVNRITRFAAARFDGKFPAEGNMGDAETALFHDIDAHLVKLKQHHEDIDIRKAANETRAIWNLANEYITAAAPWTSIKTDPARAAVSVRVGLNLCVLCAGIAAPFIPDTARKILSAFGQSLEDTRWPAVPSAAYLSAVPPAGAGTFTPPDVLFARIEDEWVIAQTAAFGGGEK